MMKALFIHTLSSFFSSPFFFPAFVHTLLFVGAQSQCRRHRVRRRYSPRRVWCTPRTRSCSPFLCKPKLLPIKSYSLQRLEMLEKRLAKEAKEKRDQDKAKRGTVAWNMNPPTASGASGQAAGAGEAAPPIVPILSPPKPTSP
ncbi:hypothetical protein STCU_10163 [Strigomonas culicis]|uniref:Uncharacterized protein n=1 Tax=Strigomonas culicis TaxID=28005 RepID=S9UUF0_9TRYP|nr:hypothetical protein STCU_10163 [Strigomonas culicis]|eukprot:EPY18141.1 hypothetical protein STCU_10163 [Strigomonas culicis]